MVDEALPRLGDRRIAHDLNDANRTRSSDVAIQDSVSFADLKLTDATYQGLLNSGFTRPSPIQLAAIPLGRCGLDLIIQSKAGTGKTCVFTVIALEALQYNPNNCIQTIVISPTREIAAQIHETIASIGKSQKKLRCALCTGGFEVRKDRVQLSNRCQIVIGTPGRLRQLIELGLLDTRNVELLILDEADKLVDEQFKLQVDDIYSRLPQDRQMLVTSATYPDELDQFLRKYMRCPQIVRASPKDEIAPAAIRERFVESPAGQSAKRTIDNKLRVLKELLNKLSFAKSIIFTNYQARAPIICKFLNADEEFVTVHGPVSYICAELRQEERIDIFNKFKFSDKQHVLVSTDVSARGIDIEDMELVVNLDLPSDSATYLHRVGRAGRFGQPGLAVSIVAEESVDRALFDKSVKSKRIERMTYDSL